MTLSDGILETWVSIPLDQPSDSFPPQFLRLHPMSEVMTLLDYLEERYGEEIARDPRFYRANIFISLHLLWQQRAPFFSGC